MMDSGIYEVFAGWMTLGVMIILKIDSKQSFELPRWCYW